MPVSRSLRRLLHVLALEEGQAQTRLESALARLRHLESVLEGATARERRGRLLVNESAYSGDAVDRLAALGEASAGKRTAASLRPIIEQADQQIAEHREVFLAKRVSRRQVEALVEKAEERENAEQLRHAQRSMDDWYLGRLQRRAPNDAGESATGGEGVELDQKSNHWD